MESKNDKNKLLGNKNERDSMNDKFDKLIKKIERKIRKNSKSFKFSNEQFQKLKMEFNDVLFFQSTKLSVLSVLPIEVSLIIKNNHQTHDLFLNTTIYSLLNNDCIMTRAYDIDTNKKLLKKFIWNYIQKTVNSYRDLKNIKHKKTDDRNTNKIKNLTNKVFERKLMKTKIIKIYEEHYGLTDEHMQGICKEHSDGKSLEEFLQRTFQDLFIEYRESKYFFEDAEKGCKDKIKLEKYLLIARKYQSYLNFSDKINLETLNDDENLSEDFKSKCDELLKKENYNCENLPQNPTNKKDFQYCLPTSMSSNNTYENTAEYFFEIYEKLSFEEKHEVAEKIKFLTPFENEYFNIKEEMKEVKSCTISTIFVKKNQGMEEDPCDLMNQSQESDNISDDVENKVKDTISPWKNKKE